MPAELTDSYLPIHKTIKRHTHPVTIRKIVNTLSEKEQDIARTILNLKTHHPTHEVADIAFTSATTGREFSASYWVEVCENYSTQEFIQYYGANFNGRLTEKEKFARHNNSILCLSNLNIVMFKIGRIIVQRNYHKSFAKKTK